MTPTKKQQLLEDLRDDYETELRLEAEAEAMEEEYRERY